ncbi:sensor histidine kinase [Nocardia callitridis]|uniref:histidine kinase n=1 Tax=Nocardia callitridis TaxID=648753 RepID=A0ABP9L5R0_9NOCA
MDVSRSLARQSVIVAAVAALTDSSIVLLTGNFGAAPWPMIAVALAIVAVDLGMALPPRTAGAVAVAQVVVRLAAGALLSMPNSVTDVGYLVAGYRAGAWLSGPSSVLSMLLLSCGVAAGRLLDSSYHVDPRLLVISMVASGCVPWLVGRYTAARGAYIADLEQREQLRHQQHRVALERAVSDERAAIARDLHDVISHHVSAVGIHAGVARMAMTASGTATTGDDTAAIRSLEAVESSSRAAMVDLRRQLDLLHGHDDESVRQPGIADIDGLVETVRTAGMLVEVHVRGAPVTLPDSVNITLYRIAQEMLTNALRHGDGTSAELAVTYTERRVRVSATNPLPRRPQSQDDTDTSLPRGLVGLRRRVELFDGRLDYGVDAERTRWHIEVDIPIGES